MAGRFPRVLIRAGLLLAALPVLLFAGDAQEPSASLRQADADYGAGVTAMSRNDLKTALVDFQSVVHLAPQTEQGHIALGSVLLRLGRSGEGIRELEKALALKPGDNDLQLNLAMAYQQNGLPAKAIPLFANLETAARAEK